MAEGALRLRAEDADDLEVLSAVLQDALVAVGEMIFIAAERRFVLVANRFRWEPAGAVPRADFERCLSGLRIDAVNAVQRRGFSPRAVDRFLVLLALRAGDGAIHLDFAGGAGIRLEVERVL